jgi:hypothetical protein
MKNITQGQLKKYLELWIAHNRMCDSEGMACPSFENFVMESEAGKAGQALGECEGGCTSEGCAEPMQEMAHEPEFPIEPEPEAPKVSPNQKEHLTLRRRNGNLIRKFEMTRPEFLKLVNGWFDHVQQSPKDDDCYRAW